MKLTRFKTILLLITWILLYSCEDEERTPEQQEREKIMAVENLLRDNQWGFQDMSISVQYESMAIPLLARVADENGMVQPGTYDSYAIYGNNKRQLNNTYTFTRDAIFLDTTRLERFDKIAGYYVLSTSQIRINPDSASSINFDYINQSETNRFILSTSSPYTQEYINSVNQRIIDAILADKPSDIAEAVVTFLQENEKVSKAIQKFLYDLIHGKVEEITQSPEELSEKLAEAIVQKLGEIDWEEVLYDKTLEFLVNLQAEDPEQKATELAQRMADKIEASLSQSELFNTLLPILQQFENETLAVLSSRIAAAVYEKIAEELSEDNVYKRVYPIWAQFTEADSVTVSETADTLAAVVTAHFFDADTLTKKLLPFIKVIEETPTRNLSELAQEIIDSVLIPTIDQINEAFPGLGLEPDWKSVKPIISSLLTTIKAKLGSSTVEDLSADLAYALIDIMDLVLHKGFEKAIFSLQQIPADQAASVVASWITNLVEMAEQPLVDFIEEKLDAIFQGFEAEKAARELSVLIHAKIIEVFSEENLYTLVLPLLEAFQEADVEKIAMTIAGWINDTGIMPGDITEEELIDELAEIISELIGKINPDDVTQALVDLLLNNNLVDILDGRILKKVLEIKIYELLGAVARNVNAINDIEIVIQLK